MDYITAVFCTIIYIDRNKIIWYDRLIMKKIEKITILAYFFGHNAQYAQSVNGSGVIL